jgi:hypothetical protein
MIDINKVEQIKRPYSYLVLDVVHASSNQIALYHVRADDEFLYFRAALLGDTNNEQMYSIRMRGFKYLFKLEKELKGNCFGLIYPDEKEGWIQIKFIKKSEI